jgi:flagellar motility protein MotE (MotC chaperone)
MKDYVATFSGMDASAAAGILSAMTDDLDLAAEILSSMSSTQRAAIMAEMDANIAARLSKIMKP